jgi:peptidoglycan/LPS O-acetylase OafA/YrhL
MVCVTAGCLALFLAVCGISFSFPPLVYLGKISYGLYVYHLLAINLARNIVGGRSDSPLHSILFWWVALLLTIGFASASYRWLEAPFLRLKDRYTKVKSRPV